MEVDEAPRSKGRFNLDRSAQEHINEGLEAWIPTESASSLRGSETQPIRPLMDVALPGYTPSSTPSSSQVSGSSSRLKEIHERLQLRSRESPARAEVPPTWREQSVRSVVIASYKKNTEGRYHRNNRMVWNAAQRVRRDCFHDASWAEYFTQSRIPDGAVHLIVGDSLVRVLTRIQSHWQSGILSFSGAATPQMLASLEMVGMEKMYTVTLMMGTNDVSRGKLRKFMRLHVMRLHVWRNFLSEFNQETKSETTLDNFKEELWNTVVKFEEPVLMGTGLYEKARKELLSKMAKLKETRQKTKDDECKDGSTLKKKTDDKMI